VSILIKGVEMPVNCAGCPCANDESRYCHAAIKYIPMLGRPDFCPLAEVEERKKGRWIERNPQNSDKCRLIECDQCGFSHIVGFNVPYEHWIENRNFCERCGADMRKGEGEKE